MHEGWLAYLASVWSVGCACPQKLRVRVRAYARYNMYKDGRSSVAAVYGDMTGSGVSYQVCGKSERNDKLKRAI